MKISLAATAAALVFLGSSSAQAADTRFFGMILLTAKTAACTVHQIGFNLPSIFYPAGVGTNGPHSAITLSYLTGAQNFTLPNASFDATFRPVENTAVFEFVNTDGNPSIRFTSQSPGTIAANTKFVEVTGRIKGLTDANTCVYDFRMIGTRLL